MTPDRLYPAIVCGYLALCLVLGGASAAGVLANLVLQLCALALGAAAVWRLWHARFDAAQRWALILLSAILALPLIQLLPLDPSVWTILPARDGIAEGFNLLDMPLPWLPLSLEPAKTFASWLALLPAAALMLATMTLDDDERQWLGWTILAVALASVLIAVGQFASGVGYIYEITNRGSGVGFFANRNHLATLLLVAIPIVTLQLPGQIARKVDESGARGRQFFGFALLAVLLIGILVAGSRAGLALALPVAVITVALRMRSRRGESPIKVMLAALALGAAMLVLVAFGPMMSRIAAKTSTFFEDETRLTAAPITAGAAWDAFPAGTGFGTFDTVFRSRGEDANLGSNFFNHAHNDYLEIWLTGGLGAVILLIGFFWWFGTSASANWRARSVNPAAVSRVAAVGVVIVLAHSLVDYPLRTAAISAVFGVFCALQMRPARAARANLDYADRRPSPMARVGALTRHPAPEGLR